MLCEKFLTRMKKILGEDGLKAYLEAFQKSPDRALRFNPVKCGTVKPSGLDKSILKPLDFWDGAWTFLHDRIGTHPYHHAGAVYVQEPSAMVPLSSVDIPANARVLDMCASPGGKTSQAAQWATDGFVVSNEIITSRAKTLSGNIERLGFKNVTVTNTDTKTLAVLFSECFDLVIVDAPCSGEGMFRKDEGAVAEWSEENVLMCARRQREILENAATCTAQGGYIIYSTCTFSSEENEENVKWFLENHSEFTLETPSERSALASVSGVGYSECRRLYPHTGEGEGQFFALFKKSEGERGEFSGKSALERLPVNELSVIEKFLKENLEYLPQGEIMLFKDNAVLVPDILPVPAKITYSCGVTLGRVEKGVFRPHHQLFSSLGGLFKNRIELSPDSEEIKKYLHGDTFNTDAPDSWACVTVDSVPVGGAKVTGGVAKNHYPKGLRNM